jgi:hypothetical protein
MGQIRTPDQGMALETTEPMLETRTRILDSTKDSVNRAETEALEVARRSGFPEAIVERIVLAVHENFDQCCHLTGATPKKGGCNHLADSR